MAADYEFLLRRAFGLAQVDTDIVNIDVPTANQKPGNHNLMSIVNLQSELSQNMLHLGLSDTAAKGELSEEQKADYKDTAYALTFALLAINNINMKGKVKAKAEKFIEHELCTDEERQELREKMMSSIDEKFRIETDNSFAKALVEHFQECYDTHYQNAQDPDAFLKEGLAYVYSASNVLKDAKPNQSIVSVLRGVSDRFKNAGFGKISTFITGELASSESRHAISGEVEPVKESIKTLEITYGTYNKTKLSDIITNAAVHHDLSDEEFEYVSQLFDNINKEVRGKEITDYEDFKDIMVNGEPMFGENDGLPPQERYCVFFQKILAGEDVSVKGKDGEIVHLKPELVEKNAPRNIFQRIFDAIVELFTHEQEKERTLNNDLFEQTKSDWSFKNTEREKVTFNELIGNNRYGSFDINKAGKSKDLSAGEKSAEPNTPTR